MKIDGFLKVPDIPGPSKRDGHEDEIEVYKVDFNMHAPYDPNSLSRRGKVALDMVVFTKHYDMSSPYLKKALFENTPFDEVVFSARRTIEGKTSDYLVVTLTDASIMSYRVHPGAGRAGPPRGGGRLRLPQDQVRLRQGPRDRDGRPGRHVTPRTGACRCQSQAGSLAGDARGGPALALGSAGQRPAGRRLGDRRPARGADRASSAPSGWRRSPPAAPRRSRPTPTLGPPQKERLPRLRRPGRGAAPRSRRAASSSRPACCARRCGATSRRCSTPSASRACRC